MFSIQKIILKFKLTGTQKSASRTVNSARNAVWSVLSYALMLVFNFINRTMFIKYLGLDYLGINGLFTNILTVLSFTELGIGGAVVYNLYGPLAKCDTERVKTLMCFYGRAYAIICAVVTAAGLCVIPFLNVIIKQPPHIDESLTLIYILFLLDMSFSYLFVYKKSLICADQQMYVTVIFTQIAQAARVVLQFFVLLIFKKYILYLAVSILSTAVCNILIAAKANELYPYLKDKNVQPMQKDERKSIFKNVKSLFVYRFASVVLNGSDNIIISNIIGVYAVGLCSNYVMVISVITGVMQQFLESFTASIGNLNSVTVKGESKKSEKVFNEMFFACGWIYGFIAGGLMLFLNPLVRVWLGDEYVLSNYTVLFLVLNFYVTGIHHPSYVFRTTMGYFVQGKFAPLAAAVINIFLSVVWGKAYGLSGIFAATVVSRALTMSIVDPLLVFGLGFKKSPVLHYLRFLLTTCVSAAICLILSYVTAYIRIGGFGGLVIKAVVYTVLFNLIYGLIYFKNTNFIQMRKGVIK